jgi:hypothetical protein
MGRVNAFLRILGGSAPSDKDYTQDNDLLPKSHPKHSEEKMADDLSLASVQSLRVGDAVSWSVGGQNPRGRIREIIREGGKQVPGTGFVLRGTKDDPGYIIEIYRQDTNNNWAPSGEYAGRKAASIMKNVTLSKMMFADEDQQIVVGPAMIPDIQIPRVDKDTKEVYYVKFAKETIARIAEKFMRENRNNDSNINHTDDNAGSYVMETWIVEHPEDKANTVYGLDVPVGTWVIKMRVADKKVWKMVKDGELKGFSIEGNFMSKEEYDKYNEEKAKYDNIVKLLNS